MDHKKKVSYSNNQSLVRFYDKLDLNTDSLFSNPPWYILFSPLILHKLLFLNAPGRTVHSQDHNFDFNLYKILLYARN